MLSKSKANCFIRNQQCQTLPVWQGSARGQGLAFSYCRDCPGHCPLVWEIRVQVVFTGFGLAEPGQLWRAGNETLNGIFLSFCFLNKHINKYTHIHIIHINVCIYTCVHTHTDTHILKLNAYLEFCCKGRK